MILFRNISEKKNISNFAVVVGIEVGAGLGEPEGVRCCPHHTDRRTPDDTDALRDD